MYSKTLDVFDHIAPDSEACNIAQKWTEWDSLRSDWSREKVELRNYLYATDTSTTGGASLPWRNRTVVPKITQIYDNLKANYSATLFPNSKWLRWEGDNQAANDVQKKKIVQSYMETKLRQSDFEVEMDKLLDDYILYGNCFATVDYVTDTYKLDTGEQVIGYVGPKLFRLSPHDIVFDPTAASFRNTPKIIKTVLQLGEVKKLIKEGNPEYEKIFDRMISNRQMLAEAQSISKSEGFVADGFSDLTQYYNSGYVELLTFYGDMFDLNTRELKENRKIVVADRAYVLSDEVWDSWLGGDNLFHSGWRSRPDNLYAMGPLDNLIGMQYRINHLENLKADIFDQIAMPTLKVKGEVDDFDFYPGSRIICGEEGDVLPLVPDATALQADFQIRELESKMEELAGAPRQAMGIRTPGEKTAFEVQTLENSASRIFQHKAQKFEREFIEPVLNAMLEMARRRMNTEDVIRSVDEQSGVEIFSNITKTDLIGKGKIRPVGARHFAERNARVQELNQLIQIKASVQDVGIHLSGKKIAEILADELGEKDLFRPNTSLIEQMETQQVAQNAEAEMMDTMGAQAEAGL